MQMLLIVLNQIEKLNALLDRFIEKGFSGATVLSSSGFVKEITGKRNTEDYPIFGLLRRSLSGFHDESKTIFMILKEDQIETAKSTVREVIGDLSKPDTAIMCTLPVIDIEGVRF